jgi:hypothetical protein
MELTIQIVHSLPSDISVQHCARQRFDTLLGGAWFYDEWWSVFT